MTSNDLVRSGRSGLRVGCTSGTGAICPFRGAGAGRTNCTVLSAVLVSGFGTAKSVHVFCCTGPTGTGLGRKIATSD